MLSMRAISKRYPGVTALASVDFDAAPGEIHALMGENGAGKSTLLKIITGVVRADSGSILLAGRRIEQPDAVARQAAGISAVYQEIGLIPTLSVADNLLLGREPRRWWGIDRRALDHQAREMLGVVGLSALEVRRTLGSLPVAVRQLIAIARATSGPRARLLILDEPTSSLDRSETARLFTLLRSLAERGMAIVLVTHFLDQVFQISDRITVLRNGRLVDRFETASTSRESLVGAMLGRGSGPLQGQRESVARCESSAVLEAVGLGRRAAIEPFSIVLRAGEVLGVAGLLGSGRTELARLLAGADTADSGAVSIGRFRGRFRSPREAMSCGIALCPEDRRTEAIFPDLSVRDNIVLAAQRGLSRYGLVRRAVHERIASELAARLDIRTPDLDRPAGLLSGGNQQKVVLARFLAMRPRVLILDEPTRGIDVGAKEEIERTVDALAADGLSVVFISSELAEVSRRAHRAAVLRDRRVVGEVAGAALTEESLMAAIAGSVA